MNDINEKLCMKWAVTGAMIDPRHSRMNENMNPSAINGATIKGP